MTTCTKGDGTCAQETGHDDKCRDAFGYALDDHTMNPEILAPAHQEALAMNAATNAAITEGTS